MKGSQNIRILRTTVATMIMLSLLISVVTTLGTFMMLGVNVAKAGSVALSITAPPSAQAGKEISVTVQLTGTNYELPIYIYLNGTLLTKVFGNYSGKILLPANLLPGTYNLSAIAINTSITGAIINKSIVASAFALIKVSGVPEPYKVSIGCFTLQSNTFYPSFDFRIIVSNTSGLVDPVAYKAILVLPNWTIKDVTLNITRVSTGIYEFHLIPALINATLYGPYTLIFNVTDSYGRRSVGSCTVTYNGVLDLMMAAIEDYVNKSVGYAINNITGVIVTQTGYVIANITSVNNTIKAVNATLVTKLDNIADQVSYLTNLVKLVNSSIISNLSSINNTLINIFNNLSSTLSQTNTTLSSLIVSANNTIIATLKNINGSLYNIILQVGNNLTNLINSSTLDILTNLTNVYNNISTLLSNYNASISNLIVAAKNNIIAEIDLANATIISRIDAINSTLSALMLVVENNIISKIIDTYNDLSDQMAAYNASITWYIGNSTNKIIVTVNNAKSDIISEINSAKQALSSQIDTVYNNLNNALNQGFGRISTEISNAQNNILSTMENYYTNILEKMANYHTVTASLITNTGGEVKAFVAGKTKDLINLIKATTGHFDQAIVTNISALKTYINDEFNSQNIRLTGMEQTLTNQLRSLLREIGSSKDTIIGMLARVNNTIIGIIGTSKKEIVLNITSLDKALADDIMKKLNEIAESQNAAKGTILSRLNAVSLSLSSNITKAKGEILEELSSGLSKTKNDIISNIQQFVSKSVGDVKNLLTGQISPNIGTTQTYTILAIALSALTLISVGGLAFLVRRA